MYVGNDNWCGGKQVKIKLRDSRGNTCETKASKPFRKNAVVTWSAYRTGTCRTNMIIDDSTKVQVVTESTDYYNSFCPRKILMYTQDTEKFESRMVQSYYSRDTNQRDHDISRSGNQIQPLLNSSIIGHRWTINPTIYNIHNTMEQWYDCSIVNLQNYFENKITIYLQIFKFY